MVYYGAWTQGADFQRTGYTLQQGASSSSTDVTGGQMDNPNRDPIEVKDICNAASSAAKSSAANKWPGGFNAFSQVSLSVGGIPSIDKTTGSYEAGTAVLSPDTALPSVTYPSGATGIEWEGASCSVVGAVWDFQTSGGQTWYQDAGMSIQPTTIHFTITTDQALMDDRQNYRAPYATSIAEIGLGPDGVQHFPAPVDLTPHLRPDGKFLTSVAVDPLGFLSVTGEVGKRALAQASFQIIATYTLHPPRHRFLYDTPPPPPGLPPLRQFPRRDGRGASSVTRHYPLDRSTQASNRRAGGYF